MSIFASLSRKSAVIGPSMSLKIISMTFFTDCYALYQRVSLFHSIDCIFDSGSLWQNHV